MQKYTVYDHDKALFFITLMLCFASCSPYRHWQAVNQDENVDKKKRDLLAPVCARQFPIIPLIDTFFSAARDSVVTYDTTYYDGNHLDDLVGHYDNIIGVPKIEWIDSANNGNAVVAKIYPEGHAGNYTKQIITKTIRIHDTLKIVKVEKDSALAYAQDQTIQSQQLQIAALQYSLNEWKDKAQHRFWLLMAITAFVIGGIYFRFKTFFITKFTSIGRFIANIIKLR